MAVSLPGRKTVSWGQKPRRRLQPLIPPFVQQALDHDRTQGSLNAFALMIDLSGFTPLTESLMQEGISGAERLSEILNDIFEPLVALVYARGGFIPYFAGDAFTAIFPVPLNRRNALYLLHTAELARGLFGERGGRFGEGYTIGIKAGLAAGTVEYGIVGDELLAFYFRGEAVMRAADCQVLAEQQGIVIDNVINTLVEGRNILTEEAGRDVFRLVGEVPDPGSNPDITQRPLPAVRSETATRFLPREIVGYDQAGEFRPVVSVFLSFDQVRTHEELDRFATLILRQVRDFGGYFKEVDYGDKGALMVIFFGAPVSYENNAVRALEFALSAQSELEKLAEDPDVSFHYRLGMTSGTAFTGIVGGRQRCQYACVGNRVNLAARIMAAADWREILVDNELAETGSFRFTLKDNILYKGIEPAVPTFTLRGRRQNLGKPNYGGLLIGRDREVAQLVDFAGPVLGGQGAGVAYVYGEAGIGKSRLTHEVRRQLGDGGEVNWLLGAADQILRKPFNPYIYLLQRIFRQSLELGPEKNLRRFQFRLNQLRQRLRAADRPGTTTALQELNRTESVLAALVGITQPRSLWTQLDAQGRYQNTIDAIVNLLTAECLLQPTVLELEDIHWIDDGSVSVTRELLRRTRDQPLLIIATARPDDNGEFRQLLPDTELRNSGVPVTRVEIGAFAETAVREMAETFLGQPIAEEFHRVLLRTTNSNPFYLEQVLEYFRENDLLTEADGQLTVQDESIKLSSSIQTILTARIDRLSEMVREIVKAAAVIGREFELPVLTEVLRSDTTLSQNDNIVGILRQHVETAERGKIWSAMNELRYIFRHSLLREAVYGMQLTTRLQQLHQQIAAAIEKIYADNIEERYVDLAFHYEQAGVQDKTIEYLGKAANYARANYQNHQALDLYERLIQKMSQVDDQAVSVTTHLNRGKVLEVVGRWEEAEAAYERAHRTAKASRDILLIGRANNYLGQLLTLRGRYQDAMKALRVALSLFESVDDIFGLAKTYSYLGNLYFRTANYAEALTYYQKSLEHGLSEAGTTSSASTISHLGLTYMNLGRYPEAIELIGKQIPLHASNQDNMGLASLHTNLGIVYFESGNYDKALEHHRQGLDLATQLGNRRLQAIGLGSLGSIYERQGDYERALDHFQQDLVICHELGDRQGIAVTEGLLGDLNSVTGNFTVAIDHLDRSLSISQELGYRKGIAKAVNTLGDIYFLQRKYERSLAYYDQAIEIARETSNRLVLGSSLVEKGTVLLQDQQFEALRPVEQEALALAEELGNPDLLFEARLLHARSRAAGDEGIQSDRALRTISQLLDRQDLDAEQEARAYLARYEISGGIDEEARQLALALYEQLYRETPKFIYNYHLSALRGED